jgi:transposase InsO family protein
MEPTRNNAGVSHENGTVEAAHGHLKTGLDEALELRGARDFPDLAAYQAFLQEFIARKNARRREEVAVELAALLPRAAPQSGAWHCLAHLPLRVLNRPPRGD